MTDSFNAPIKDSGTRATFSTGAQRDVQVGKGRMDLLPPAPLIQLTRPPGDYGFAVPPLPVGAETAQYLLLGFMIDYDPQALIAAARHLLFQIESDLGKSGDAFENYVLSEFGGAITEVAKHFEKGAAKYAARNWEAGMPLSRFFDSAYRHLTQYLAGATDEPHLVAACWNVLCLYQTGLWIQQGILPQTLQDLPGIRLAEGVEVGTEVVDYETAEAVDDRDRTDEIEAYQQGYEEGCLIADKVFRAGVVLTPAQLGGYTVHDKAKAAQTIADVLYILGHAYPEEQNPVDALNTLAQDFHDLGEKAVSLRQRVSALEDYIGEGVDLATTQAATEISRKFPAIFSHSYGG